MEAEPEPEPEEGRSLGQEPGQEKDRGWEQPTEGQAVLDPVEPQHDKHREEAPPPGPGQLGPPERNRE